MARGNVAWQLLGGAAEFTGGPGQGLGPRTHTHTLHTRAQRDTTVYTWMRMHARVHMHTHTHIRTREHTHSPDRRLVTAGGKPLVRPSRPPSETAGPSVCRAERGPRPGGPPGDSSDQASTRAGSPNGRREAGAPGGSTSVPQTYSVSCRPENSPQADGASRPQPGAPAFTGLEETCPFRTHAPNALLLGFSLLWPAATRPMGSKATS